MANLPTMIGAYPVLGLLATGGQAEVFLCKRVGAGGLERPVVVKRVLPHLARETQFVNMFVDEARIVASLRHPNVVDVYELGQEGDDLFLVMEYLEGETAAALMRRLRARKLRLPPAIAAWVVAEACAGLHEAHELEGPNGEPLGLVHRDVSPHNLFLTYRGGIKVIDFGVALAAERLAEKTDTGVIKGKTGYMAPEQCLGKPLDRRADIFALGAVLFELSTGRRLFKRANDALTFQAILSESVARPSDLIVDFPPMLEQIIERAVSRDPERRYPSAERMRRDLVKFARTDETEPRDALEHMMRKLFSERLEVKSELVSRVKAGMSLTAIPRPEVDEDVALPAAWDDRSGPTESATEPREVSASASSLSAMTHRSRARAVWPWGAALAVAAGGAAALVVLGRSDPQTRGAESPPSSSAPAESPPSASPQARVTVAVSTEPSGATVSIDGEARGESPLSIELPRSDHEVEIAVEKEGRRRATERIVPDVDTRLRLTLPATDEDTPEPEPTEPAPKPKPASQPRIVRPPPPPEPTPPPEPSGGFRRFD